MMNDWRASIQAKRKNQTVSGAYSYWVITRWFHKNSAELPNRVGEKHTSSFYNIEFMIPVIQMLRYHIFQMIPTHV